MSEYVNPLSVLGFKSESNYRRSNLFRTISLEVLKRDNCKCQFKTCSADDLTVARVVFLHKTLSTYLGIGCFNIFSVCGRCFELNLPYKGLLFALSGYRAVQGRNRPEIGKWYADRFKSNREVARAIYKQLGNHKFIKQKILSGEIGRNYVEYLGLKGIPKRAILKEC